MDFHIERQRGQQQGQTGGKQGQVFFAYRVIPPSIDNLRVNHCALRADCVCLDRAKGREVVYRKSWGWYRSPFSIKTIMGSFFRQHAKLCQMKTRGRKEKKFAVTHSCANCAFVQNRLSDVRKQSLARDSGMNSAADSGSSQQLCDEIQNQQNSADVIFDLRCHWLTFGLQNI